LKDDDEYEGGEGANVLPGATGILSSIDSIPPVTAAPDATGGGSRGSANGEDTGSSNTTTAATADATTSSATGSTTRRRSIGGVFSAVRRFSLGRSSSSRQSQSHSSGGD
jgi:hypothetical protein